MPLKLLYTLTNQSLRRFISRDHSINWLGNIGVEVIVAPKDIGIHFRGMEMDKELLRNIKEDVDSVLADNEQVKRIIKDPNAIKTVLNEKEVKKLDVQIDGEPVSLCS